MHDGRVFGKDGTGLWVFDVRFKRHRPFRLERLQYFGHQEHHRQVIFLFVARTLEHLAQAAHGALDHHHAVAHQHGARSGAGNDEGFNRSGLDDGRHLATGHDVPTKHATEQYEKSYCIHSSTPLSPGIRSQGSAA